jgi:23S rRNA pseudouridine1911/1915/1917 synthase
MNSAPIFEFTVPAETAGNRVDRFLSRSLPGSVSRSQIQKLFLQGNVLVNGAPVQKSAHVSVNDRIIVKDIGSVNVPTSLEPQDIPLSILLEDDYFIAIDKPAGLVVHPGSGNWDGTLVNALLFARPQLSDGPSPDRPGIVHRLDKDTSGIIVVAKTNAAHAALAGAFSSRTITKTYYGFCIGKPRELEGIINLALGKSRSNPMKQTPVPDGKASQTGYRVLGSESGIVFVKFSPRTGRTHQIRVHCASKGFPILMDELYGGGPGRIMRLEPADRPFAKSVMSCFTRHALHAQSISFTHPFTGKETTVSAPFPKDFQEALRLFKKSPVDSLQIEI